MEPPEQKRASVGQVLAPSAARAENQPRRGRPELGLKALWRALLILLLVALTDLVVLWVPADFGNLEWEFGTFSQTVDSLPLLTMMLAGMVAVGLASGNKGALRVLAACCLVMLVVLGGIAVLYALNVPLVWQRAASTGAMTVMRKAFVKMAALSTLYVVLYGFLGVLALKGSRHIQLQ